MYYRRLSIYPYDIYISMYYRRLSIYIYIYIYVSEGYLFIYLPIFIAEGGKVHGGGGDQQEPARLFPLGRQECGAGSAQAVVD